MDDHLGFLCELPALPEFIRLLPAEVTLEAKEDVRASWIGLYGTPETLEQPVPPGRHGVLVLVWPDEHPGRAYPIVV